MAIDPGAGAGAADHQEVLKAHGFHPLRVKGIVQETDDAKSFVLDVPEHLKELFRYEPGQFCTFRVHMDGEEHLRSYSMSSAPETDADLTVTVKRVPGGLISNWLVDHVSAGDTLETTRPAGVFCLQERTGPVVAFCGGSGITPVMAITKKALVRTSRPVSLVYANRSRDSVIFQHSLEEMCARHPGRLRLHHHFDTDSGYMDRDRVARMAEGADDADFYICGPAPFMDLVDATLHDIGIPQERIFIERFVSAGQSALPAVSATPETGTEVPETVTIIMKGKRTAVDYQRGDTVLETARRGALNPPFSCESGNCATCMALLKKGTVTMRVNNALTPEEVEEGWILTCQALPEGETVTVEYESY